MTRVGAEERLQPAYNVYTKPLWADKSETIYRARESEAMKYVAEEAMKQAGLGDSLSKQADAEEAKYQSQSKRGGPLEVGMPGGYEVVHRRRDQSKWKEEKEGGGLMCLFEQGWAWCVRLINDGIGMYVETRMELDHLMTHAS